MQAVAARAGVNLGTAFFDYGVDGTFRRIIKRRQRLFESGFALDYQLKASARWQAETAHIVYDLAAKTYNDLVLRNAGEAAPLLLLLLCLPQEPAQWLECNERQLLLRGGCYWSFVTGNVTKNVRTVRLRIPRQQLFTPAAMPDLLARAARGGRYGSIDEK